MQKLKSQNSQERRRPLGEKSPKAPDYLVFILKWGVLILLKSPAAADAQFLEYLGVFTCVKKLWSPAIDHGLGEDRDGNKGLSYMTGWPCGLPHLNPSTHTTHTAQCKPPTLPILRYPITVLYIDLLPTYPNNRTHTSDRKDITDYCTT